LYFLIAGSVLFYAVHFFSAFRSRAPGLDVRDRIGSMRFMAVYSVISLLGFVLMVWGYWLAKPSPIVFTPPLWGRHITWALMLPAFILLTAAYTPRGYIKKYVKHPMLLATIFWSFGHLLANGERNSLILFGGFLAFALIDRLAVIGRPESVKKTSGSGDVLAVIIGCALYWATISFLHTRLIGVPITS
jgi:uncharacterized membrane protein